MWKILNVQISVKMVKMSLLHTAFFHALIDFFKSAFNGFVIVFFFSLESFDVCVVDADSFINAVDGGAVHFARSQACGAFWNTIYRRVP